MKPIAVTTYSGGRRDFFRVSSNFGMVASGSGIIDTPDGYPNNMSFGGIFTSVPVAVAAMAVQPPIIHEGEVLEANAAHTAVAETSFEPDTPVAATQGMVIGNGSTGGIHQLTERVDLFGLGLNYAVYHKRLWGKQVQRRDERYWQNLGGDFTSAPAAIAWADGRVDLFAVGTDHALYTKTCIGEQWDADWQYLGGNLTSAATPLLIGSTLYIFARGHDFTLRVNHTNDGENWFGWQNHGGELASQPAVFSWGPDRIDVFAIWKDRSLRHLWWDGEIWNEWESLGGNYRGQPAVAAWEPGRLDVFVQAYNALLQDESGLRHHWFSDNRWHDPVSLTIGGPNVNLIGSPTVISPGPNQLEVFLPCDDEVRIGKWDGQAWSFNDDESGCRVPQRYRISVDYVRCLTPRSRNADTGAAAMSVAVGNEPVRFKTQWIGDIGSPWGSETSQTNLLRFESVTVDLAEPMSFNYIVINKEADKEAEQEKILAALANGGNALSVAGSKSMIEDIEKRLVKFITVKIADLAGGEVPVLGSIVKLIANWLLGKLTDLIFESCDGIVAVELRAMMGRTLYDLTDKGRKTVKVTTPHEGTDSPWSCGSASEYEVTWTIEPL